MELLFFLDSIVRLEGGSPGGQISPPFYSFPEGAVVLVSLFGPGDSRPGQVPGVSHPARLPGASRPVRLTCSYPSGLGQPPCHFQK